MNLPRQILLFILISTQAIFVKSIVGNQIIMYANEKRKPETSILLGL